MTTGQASSRMPGPRVVLCRQLPGKQYTYGAKP